MSTQWETVEEHNTITGNRRYFVRKGKTCVAGLSALYTDDDGLLDRTIFRSRRKAGRKAQELNIGDAWGER